jgi:hypothetical protein
MNLSRREKRLIHETLILRMVKSGLTFGDYLLLSELRFLWKEDSREHLELRLLALSDILLNQTLSWEERVMMVEKIYEGEGRDYRRIYGNLKKKWIPEKFISLREVPLETYMDSPKRGQPYSSYCKGYGEGSSRGQEKTPICAELDGEEPANLDIRILKLAMVILNLIFQTRKQKLWRQGKEENN